jgi:hypothetical protein
MSLLFVKSFAKKTTTKQKSLLQPQTTQRTNGAPRHHRARGRSKLARRPPQRGMGPRRQTQRRRGGVAADEGVQGGASGAKDFLSTLPGLVVCSSYTGRVGGVWRLELATMRWEHRDLSLQPRVLRGAWLPSGAQRSNSRRRRLHLEGGNAFFRGGRGVRGAPATVTRRILRCSRIGGGGERQRRGASAPARRRRW